MTSPVTYDRRSFSLNGKPFIIFSGSVHYPRVHPSRWSRLFQTFHDAGLNTVETYVFWRLHEPPPPVTAPPNHPLSNTSKPIFDDALDLFAFIAAAARTNLHVILRLGPYVCAEVDYGGFPVRLRDVPDIQFRTWNEPFMREVEAWVCRIADTLHSRSLLASHGGPVILFQLENEYSMVSHQYGHEGVKYLQWMADLQKRLALNIPAIMCYGAAEGVVETINSFYAHNELCDLRARRPDEPPVWTECWSGWYDVWGARHHTRPTPDLLYAVARFFAGGGAGVNYYMWMGGTNVGRSTMYLQTTSYDYDAPIDEFYNDTTKSRAIARLHHILQTRFAPHFHRRRGDEPVPLDATNTVFQWGDIAFVCNDTDKESDNFVIGSKPYTQSVSPCSVHIVDANSHELLYNTAHVASQNVLRRTFSPIQTKASDWSFVREPIAQWSTARNLANDGTGQSRRVVEGDHPAELVALTAGSSDYAMYATRFRIGAGSAEISFDAGDFAHVFVNGKYSGSSAVPLWEDRWPNRWNEYADGGPQQRVRVHVSDLQEGEIDVCVMVSSLGLVKGDWQLGERNMLEEKKGLLSDVSIRGDDEWTGEQLVSWRSVGKLRGEVEEWCKSVGKEGAQIAVDEELTGEVAGWYGCEVEVEALSHGWVVDLKEVGKGMLFVNGVLLGRFWNVCGTRPRNGFLNDSPIVQVGEEGEPTQRYYHIPAWVVKDELRDDGDSRLKMHVVLFVESGPAPKGTLPFLEAQTE